MLGATFSFWWTAAASLAFEWTHDPQSVTMLAIAVVGGGFAFYRFRFIPRERRRETLNAMQKHYGKSATERAALLPSFPPFVLLGRQAVEKALEKAKPEHADLRKECQVWEDGLTELAAHEIRASEVKFRSLLWAVFELAPRLSDPDPASATDRKLVEEIKTARTLVNQLNDFAQMVELNLFPQDDVLGQLHRSIAPACVAVEPVIWSQNAIGGRWGLRVPRLLRRAEGFNETRAIHRTSRLVWRRGDGSAIQIQAALRRIDFGMSVPSPRLEAMPWTDRFRLRLEMLFVRVLPRYGGSRLRRHLAAENELIGRLKFAYQAGWDPLDFGWNMKTLDENLAQHRKAKLEPAAVG